MDIGFAILWCVAGLVGLFLVCLLVGAACGLRIAGLMWFSYFRQLDQQGPLGAQDALRVYGSAVLARAVCHLAAAVVVVLAWPLHIVPWWYAAACCAWAAWAGHCLLRKADRRLKASVDAGGFDCPKEQK